MTELKEPRAIDIKATLGRPYLASIRDLGLSYFLYDVGVEASRDADLSSLEGLLKENLRTFISNKYRTPMLVITTTEPLYEPNKVILHETLGLSKDDVDQTAATDIISKACKYLKTDPRIISVQIDEKVNLGKN